MISFPFVELSGHELSLNDGFLFSKAKFCGAKFPSKKCQNFYKDAQNSEGFMVCPFGFTCYFSSMDGKKLAITSFLVRGKYDKRKISAKINNDFIPAFPEDEFLKIIQKNKIALSEISEYRKAKADFNYNDELNKSTMHEIRKLNRDIKSQSEEMKIHLEKRIADEFLSYRAENIFGTSSLISIRLNAYDFIANPEFQQIDKALPTSIYKKFEKVKHCLQNRCAIKKLKIKFLGSTFHEIDAYRIFEVLPYVFFENSIKYSPENQEILVGFKEFDDCIRVQIENIGPVITESEVGKIFENHFRAKSVRDKFEGTGMGLFFAKKVCDLHGVKVSASSSNSVKWSADGVSYSNFKITIMFPKS